MATRTIRIRAVFRPGDDDAVTVLRLLAAANDFYTVARLLPGARGVEEQTHSQKEIAGADRRYLFRMSVLHCEEIEKLVNHKDLTHAVERYAQHGDAFSGLPELMKSLRERMNKGPFREVLSHLRNRIAGHYDRDAFARALELLDDGDLMDLPLPPVGDSVHFNVTDSILDALLVEKSHAHFRQEDAERSVEAAMKALTSVIDVVMHLATGLTFAMYEEAQGR